jgi:hypothetical protein
VRENSYSQTAASHTNGGKSRGPTSVEGKKKSRLNALKNGLFSRDIVVTAAGERIEDFESVQRAIWDSVQPDNALEEILTDDLLANWWRRQRVRRSESAELRSRLENLDIQNTYLPSNEIEPLKFRFCLLLERYRAMRHTPAADFNEIVTELENARSQLALTSLGLEFLMKKVNDVKTEAKSAGQISDASLETLCACVGLTNDIIPLCIGMNSANKTQSAKAAEYTRARQCGGTGQSKEAEKSKDQRGGTKEAEEWNKAGKAMLVSAIEIAAHDLKVRTTLMKWIEKCQRKTGFAAAILPADSTCDRFSRAETAYDRRFYRALAALLTMKEVKNASKVLS